MEAPQAGRVLTLVLAVLGSAGLCQGQCEVLKLTGPLPDAAGNQFGLSVALDGDRMTVGRPDWKQGYAGGVDLFERQAGGAAWVFFETLVPSDGEEYDQFGYSVALAGQTVVVGAPSHGAFGGKGAAYVFERQDDGTWLETAKLPPPNEAWAFGWSVDIDGDRIAVGAAGMTVGGDGTGRVAIFEREGGTWLPKDTFQPLQSVFFDSFGASLDLQGERIVVGAPSLVGFTGFDAGHAFVFERSSSGTAWQEKAMLSAPDALYTDRFGQDVALDGERVVVGAPWHGPAPNVGAAFVFDLLGAVWTQTAKLYPSAQPTLEDFASAVDAEGARVIAGARNADGAAGAAYRFEEGPGGWAEVERFQGSGIGSNDTFGYALDLRGSEVLVGAPHAGEGLSYPGYAFLFALDLPGPSLLADAGVVSLSQGVAQGLQLGACLEHAGDFYFLAGSATGTSPGFVLGGLPVPLNPDAYFLHTLSHPGSPPLATSFGVLDAWGKGSSSCALPPGSQATLAGLTLHHAYAVLDAGTLQLEAVSPAVPVALVP
jgi:hypothetical protein